MYTHITTRSTCRSIRPSNNLIQLYIRAIDLRQRQPRTVGIHTTSITSRSFRTALPNELRILRAEKPKDIPKSTDEKDTLASRAVSLAKERLKEQQTSGTSAATVSKPKKTIWQKVKEEAVHYWHGTKLLGLEIRISSKLTWKLLNGGHLTRREARQLRRTTSDLLRLIPFAVFIIVPFMELLLPVALKLFPNMLPSTFENKSLEEEKKRKLLKVRLEMARFLQETISETGFAGSDNEESAKEFADFFRKIRITGEQASTEDLLNVARRFEDELTLDNLSRPQLVSMCRYMNINAFGTDNFLRFQIRNRMRQIKADDKVIQAEGIESLTIQELQAACAARGFRSIGISPGRLQDELEQWVDLHLNHHVPSTLLVLSRAFSFTDRPMTTEEALKATFNSLPDNLVNEAELQVLEMVGTSTYKQKLDVLEQQQELIEDESEQEEKEAKARADAKEAAEEAERKRQEEEEIIRKQQAEADKRDTFITEEETEEEKKEEALSKEQQDELHEALAKLRTKVDVLEERAQLNEIKIQHEDYKELIEELKEATHKDADKTTARLGKRLEKMLTQIDKDIDAMEKEHKEKEQKSEDQGTNHVDK
ncbi:LETM1-like protein-domain-containing protein [Halteromyces radiatus]|uniref:LETM1-like protein-domain-containing protein n=1 Tax=Halteromyces radiatus TaxID=101107 RepID=UPI002220C83D|nr:LETM1-like protein-domain-containing protein [Halteromyces radiatus]KAI8088768.1 LETM1-like protein-domain-containing protein [Halteromyces radiatus]